MSVYKRAESFTRKLSDRLAQVDLIETFFFLKKKKKKVVNLKLSKFHSWIKKYKTPCFSILLFFVFESDPGLFFNCQSRHSFGIFTSMAVAQEKRHVLALQVKYDTRPSITSEDLTSAKFDKRHTSALLHSFQPLAADRIESSK